jgi:hypothetical protein
VVRLPGRHLRHRVVRGAAQGAAPGAGDRGEPVLAGVLQEPGAAGVDFDWVVAGLLNMLRGSA